MSGPIQTSRLTELLREACRLEVLAHKPGNVHPDASFSDLTCDDFLRSADAIAPILAETAARDIGTAVLEAVRATRAAVPTNSNLGMILLLAPLVAVPSDVSLHDGIGECLRRTTVEDARLVYQAIRLAAPGGLGRADDQDVENEPTLSLTAVMRLAAARDRIAAQYAHDFADVLDLAVPTLLQWSARTGDWEQSIIGLHLSLLARFPDSLIARKCGDVLAAESAERAQHVLYAGWPETDAARALCVDLDGWLRADQHRRNPGATADLVAATLFAAMRDHGWSAGAQ